MVVIGENNSEYSICGPSEPRGSASWSGERRPAEELRESSRWWLASWSEERRPTEVLRECHLG